MEQIRQIAETFSGVVRLMVDYPDDVPVSPFKDGEGFVLEIRVSRMDVGKVIGKMGRTARSLRQILQAVSLTHKIPIALDIVDEASVASSARIAAR